MDSWCYDHTPWTTIFLPSIYSPFPYCTIDILPSLDAFVDCAPLLLPYLLHALPSPLPYYLCMHQHLLMCTPCAPFVPTSPHGHLMYHCTFVHATMPPNMCNTTPLVCTLVV